MILKARNQLHSLYFIDWPFTGWYSFIRDGSYQYIRGDKKSLWKVMYTRMCVWVCAGV